jgi:hypothetical protein
MQCRDAQFYLRLRRHTGDELGADVTVELDRHLTGCPSCAADARVAESFDRAVAAAVRAVPVPAGLREKLLTQASAHHGTVIRRRLYKGAALAASLFLVVGLACGVFFAPRPVLDTNALCLKGDELYQDPSGVLRHWLTEQKLSDLPKPFDPKLLVSLGTESVQGCDVPVAVFRHPDGIATERGFAKVYLFRTDGAFNLKDLQEAQGSHTRVEVIDDRARFPGVKFVILHTVHPVGRDDWLKPFLLPGSSA